jgi:hypothetical protein
MPVEFYRVIVRILHVTVVNLTIYAGFKQNEWVIDKTIAICG